MKLAYKSILELKEMIQNKELTAREVWDYFISRNDTYNKELWAFLNIGLKNFKEKNNTDLQGLPLWVKDIYCEKDIPTSWASNMLREYTPPYDATLIKKLNEAGMNSSSRMTRTCSSWNWYRVIYSSASKYVWNCMI